MNIRLSMVSVLASIALATVGPAYGQAAPPDKAASGAATIDAATRKRVVEAAIAEMTREYVHPKAVPAISKVLRSGLSDRYRSIADPQTFVEAVNADLARTANDRHLRLLWSRQPLPKLPNPEHVDPALLQEQQAFMARRNFAIRQAQVLDGNIGYLKINGFLPPDEAGATLSAAMAFLKHSDALVIDLRDNGGGDPDGVAMLVSYLVPPDTLINTFHRRDKDVADQVWTMPYVPGGRWSIDRPVFVLTSNDTASGAEEFAYDLQQLKRGTVVGASTWGGANPGKMVPIDDHFAIFIPFGSAINPISNANWEGIGVKPDVAVKPSEALATARQLALEGLLRGATGDRRAELQSFLDAARAH